VELADPISDQWNEIGVQRDHIPLAVLAVPGFDDDVLAAHLPRTVDYGFAVETLQSGRDEEATSVVHIQDTGFVVATG
jgi:hypothetical protein